MNKKIVSKLDLEVQKKSGLVTKLIRMVCKNETKIKI